MLYYMIVISLISIVITVYDKAVSKKKGHRRIPEKTLMLSGILGGSFAMYITMLIIRHKTRHKKFMLGLPAVMIIQAVAAALYYFYI